MIAGMFNAAPHMLPTIPAPPLHNIELGPLTLHVYGLLIGIAIIVAMRVAELLLTRWGADASTYMRVIIPAIIGGFVGARLYHVASEPVRYAREPLEIFAVWNGGLGIYGAVLGGALVVWWRVRQLDGSFADWADAVAVSLPLAQAIGRWGNYVNQELFGRPTSLPWGLEVDPAYRPAAFTDDCCFHPTFLYESLANLALFGVLLLIAVRWKTRIPGTIFATYLIGYSAIRIVVEGLRIDTAHEWLGMRQNQWVALLILISATVTLVILARQSRQRTGPRQ
jgi:prolipoprotein diacylglyceryl transferase